MLSAGKIITKIIFYNNAAKERIETMRTEAMLSLGRNLNTQ